MSFPKTNYLFKIIENYLGFLLSIYIIVYGLNYLIQPPAVLSCDRSQNMCFIHQKYIWNKVYKVWPKFPLNELIETKYLPTTWWGKFCLDFYSPSLEDNLTFFCRSDPFFSSAEQDEVLNKIKHALYSSQKEFEITDIKGWTSYINGIFWIIIGLGILYWFILERKRIKSGKN